MKIGRFEYLINDIGNTIIRDNIKLIRYTKTPGDVEESYLINDYQFYIKFKDGYECVFDFYDQISYVVVHNEEMTKERFRIHTIENLKRFMKVNFITQEELARRVGCTRQTISRIINMERDLTLGMIYDISKALRIAPQTLIYHQF